MNQSNNYFEYLSEYRLLICKHCKHAVCLDQIRAHLRGKRHELPPKETAAALAEVQRQWKDAAKDVTEVYIPTRVLQPIAHLPLYKDGLLCQLDYPKCHYVCRDIKTLKDHWKTVHHWTLGTQGGSGKQKTERIESRLQSARKKIYCQRFFSAFQGSRYFQVDGSGEEEEEEEEDMDTGALSASQEGDLIRMLVEKDLQERDRRLSEARHICHNEATKTEVSPWLEVTRWPSFFHGLDLSEVSTLAYAADPTEEPLLALLSESLDRLVERAHQSICEDKISVFDQARINSFMAGEPSGAERLLMIKLQKNTFRSYKNLWKRLLCFACRTSRVDQPIQLPHRFTPSQLSHVEAALSLSNDLRAVVSGSDSSSTSGEVVKHQRQAEVALDRACLLLCICLLDHNIRGSHFESPVLSFLAVIGIDTNRDCGFHGPLTYSPQLSKFIKIAQMLVIERAVLAADEGAVEYPSDLLDEMRQRFMVRGSRSAFDWACRLRAYAKKVVSNTTVTGYIIWSEDYDTVIYKQATLSMERLKSFVSDQVRQAQQELRDLLLVHPEENHEEIVPTFHLHRLQDDHSNDQNGWSFLHDPRNAAEFDLPGGSDSWLMNRVLDNDWLRDEFVCLGKKRELRWKKPAVSQYLTTVDYFLERLLLLVHLTSGQPARGTELVSLQHSNTRQGHHRSIFIENGLIGTVTSYHKGYNVTGSTKIIHRYLPREVSELLVYYLWLVLPFWQKLETLAFKRLPNSSSFLWPKGAGGWDSSKLGAVLARETSAYLGAKLNVMTYRHIAIAISRQHLRCGGFKRDYGMDKKLADEQSTHGSWIAGTVYARGLQEAPGHVEARRMEYRAISREWHSFLGFRVYLGARKRPLEEGGSQGNEGFRKVRLG